MNGSVNAESNDLDPNQFKERLERILSRFISTSSPINTQRAPGLASSLSRLVADQELVKGPYIETLPDYVKGRSIADLVAGGVLAPEWSTLDSGPLYQRQLHAHQDAAIARNDNYLVATGTGSGKTESFLFPLIDDILRQGNLDQPGVRAILVYPLNALANDQLTRIARLLFRDLADPGITLGRYTGQVSSVATREEETSKLLQNPNFEEDFPGFNDMPSNWLLSRAEMRATPPHILITNYAMLEHILLLPRNRILLNGAKLNWLVLDEIHTYAGAQAIEVAFLLRRLKSFLGLEEGRLRCVGTSASLDPARKVELSGFASNLFGEPFASESAVITSQRKRHPHLSAAPSSSGLSVADWIRAAKLSRFIHEERKIGNDPDAVTWNDECDFNHLPQLKVDEARPLGVALMARLGSLSEICDLADKLNPRAFHLDEMAAAIFPAAEPAVQREALVSLISIGVLAVSHDQSIFPLLPARYHMIASSVDTVAVVLDAEAQEKISELVVGGTVGTDGESPAYKLMVCRNCGEPYVEGWNAGGRIRPTAERSAIRTVLRLVDGPKASDVDEDDDEDPVDDDGLPPISIDPATGMIISSGERHGVHLEPATLIEDPDERAFYMRKCLACGYAPRRYGEPITGIHPGDDAFTAVCAQSLLEAMPERKPTDDRPMKARNLLVFSDNRQDAAFFAPFFERTSREQAIRAAILKVVESAGKIDLPNLATAVRRRLDAKGLRLYSGGLMSARETGENELFRLKGLIVAELTTSSRLRNSLEGFGLIHVDYVHIDRAASMIANVLPEISKRHALPLAKFFLKIARTHRAISKNPDHGIRHDDDSIWTAAFAQDNRAIGLNSNPRSKLLMNFKPAAKRENRFTWFLQNCFGLDVVTSIDVLEAFFRAINSSRSMCSRHGVGLGLKLDESLMIETGRNKPLYRCTSCGSRTQFDIGGHCQSYKCGGKLVEISSVERVSLEEANHYIHRYLETPLLGIAREHTAAISTEVRGQIEQEFKEGEVNLLSCTTTMEMGVDLGDLESVLCKNVPPNIANYQQRAGRAGRRAQVAPIVLTTARSSRFDQAKFREFSEYLEEKPAVPYLSLDNANFFRRHQISVMLSGFLSHRLRDITRNGTPRLSDIFGSTLDDEAHDAFDKDLSTWMASNDGCSAARTGEVLVATLPDHLTEIGLTGEDLGKAFFKRVTAFRDAIEGRWQTYQEQILQLMEVQYALAPTDNDGHQRIGRKLVFTRSQQTRFMNQMLIDQLSRRALIPTYSFPVYSVSLEIISSRKQTRDNTILELDRDGAIGISEYAPGSEVIAGGRVWLSRGIIKKDKFSGDDAFVEQGKLRVCEECFFPEVTTLDAEKTEACPQCNVTYHGQNVPRQFIRPKGFLTSYADAQGKDPGAARVKSRATDDARLLTAAPFELYKPTEVPGILTFHAPGANAPEGKLGRIISINKGPKSGGFAWCGRCEHAEPAMPHPVGWQTPQLLPSHRNPRTDEPCNYDKQCWPVDLGHVFETDVRSFLINAPQVAMNGTPINVDDRMRKTLREAFRLAVVRLLETDPRDLRATDQRVSGAPVIVLYDAVAGGAGYTTRLTEDPRFSMRTVLEEVRHILDCSNKLCITSCTRCLNDYSNQKNWPDFDRHPALEWIKHMLAAKT